MALPKDPTIKTSAAAPPPKKPPVVDADEIFTPKPPPDLPPNVRVSSPAQAITNLRIPDVSDEALIAAFKDKPLYVLDRVSWSKLTNPYRKRLENLINKDPGLKKILDYVLPVYPPAAPQPQPQPAPTAPAQEIPPATAEQLTKQEAAVPPKEKELEDLTPPERQKLETWLNGIKPGFYEYLAEKKFDAATSQHMFTNSFLEYLAMYKGGLAGFYLSQGAHELMYSALGPIGEALSGLHQKDLRWKMAWMKNPLNPNALYYYLNVLPEESAFKLLFLPVKASWGILARGGAPLITKATYQETDRRRRDYGQIKQGYFFSPFLKASQAGLALADGLDKLSRSSINNNQFRLNLKALKDAKKSGDKKSIQTARREIKNILNQYDGKFGQAIFRNGLKNLSRRLRHASQDPITGIFALIAGTIVDIFVGIGVNFVRAIANKIINVIPGINTLRATLTEFFTSNRWLQTARIGGATGQTFLKGAFSMTTASSTYAGASIGGGIANALGLPAYPFQVIGGGVGATFGSIYTTSLKLANNPGFINWIKEIRYWENIINTTGSLAQKATAQTALNKLSLKGFRIGPLSKFANFLHQRWWARLPVNGLVIADLGVKFLGWSPWAYPSLIAGDWVWQTRGAWSSAIARWFPTTPLGRWIGNQALSVQTWFTEKIFMRPIAWETSSLLGKMPVKWGLRPFWQFMQNTWSTIQPYATTVFNPGFFLGAQFLGSVFMSMGLPWGVAHLVGGLAGAGVWWGVHGIYSAIAGKGAMSLAQWSAAGWVGYFGGLIAQGLLSLLGVHGVWMQFLPLAGSLIATVGVALIPGLGGLLGSFFAGLSAYNIAWALGISSTAYAAGMAIAATVASIALVAGLTIFSGFVIFSAFWVPLQEMMHAGPQSACFNLQTTAPQTLTPGALIEVCSKFTVKEPGLLSEYGYFEHHLGVINLDIDDDHPQNNLTKVSRRIPGETEVILQYDGDYNLNPHASSTFNNTKYALYNEFCTNNPTTGLCQDLFINTFLSTYTSYETGKKTIFELQQDPKYSKFYGLKQFTNDYIDLLQQVKNDESGTKAKLLASQTVMEEIKSNYNKIVKLLNDAQGQNDLVAVRGKITDAYSIAETKAKPENNPFQEEINSLESSCPFQPSSCQEQINVYKSYPGFFSNQLSSLSLLLNQLNNPQMAVEEAKIKVKEAYQQADFTLQGLTQQIKALRETRNTIIDIDLNPWLSILNNISGASQEQINTMLSTLFGSFFNKGYFFTPGSTVYEVCVKGKYIGPTDQPVTFSSSVNMVQAGGFRTDVTTGMIQLNTNACSAISTVTVNP